MHSIIDGPIDADKLDYLVRDSKKLNVPYGLAIDFERLSKVLTVVHKRSDEYMWAAVGVQEKGKVSAESVAFARYCMFGAVYWHRTSRSVKAMIHHAAWQMLSRTVNRKDPLATEIESLRDELKNILRKEYEDVPDATKKELRRKLIDLILRNQLPTVQQDLFREANTEEMQQALWPGITMADLQILAWLWRGCAERARRLLEALALRKLYKRVLVVSKEKNREIWSKASAFARSSTSPSAHLNLEARMQEQIILHLQRLPSDDKRQTAAFNDESLRELYSVAEEYPIILVDIPSDRTAGMKSLFFFGETDRWRYHTDELVRIRVEESVVWSSIVEAFSESIGKIRLFAHPRAVEVIRAINPKALEALLYNSLTT